jgi:hypothetical protein
MAEFQLEKIPTKVDTSEDLVKYAEDLLTRVSGTGNNESRALKAIGYTLLAICQILKKMDK